MGVSAHAETNCRICAKHRGEGPLVGPVVWADEYLMITHRPVGEDGTTVLGYLYVDSRRHVPYLADLLRRYLEPAWRPGSMA